MSSLNRKIDTLSPPSCPRKMEVLCLSAPRSGSTSLGQALKTLGYKPFAGMAHNYHTDNRWPLWNEAIEARYYGKGLRYTREDFEKFLGSYDSVSGWGAAILAEDLVAAYPDAKVVLTTRDPDEWVESWNGSVVTVHKWWRKWRWILPLCGGLERDFRVNAELSLHAWSHGDPFDKAEQRKIYVEHNQLVRSIVPKERLLEMSAGGDWESLCGFLGKEVPKGQAYPHGGEREGFHKRMGFVWARALVRAALRVGVGVGLCGIILFLVLRYRHAGSIQDLLKRFKMRLS